MIADYSTHAEIGLEAVPYLPNLVFQQNLIRCLREHPTPPTHLVIRFYISGSVRWSLHIDTPTYQGGKIHVDCDVIDNVPALDCAIRAVPITIQLLRFILKTNDVAYDFDDWYFGNIITEGPDAHIPIHLVRTPAASYASSK